MTNLNWQLHGAVASIENDGCKVSIDLAKPGAGVQIFGGQLGSTSPWHILGFESDGSHGFDLNRLDAYSRARSGCCIRRSASEAFTAQAYWRCLEPKEFFPDHPNRVIAAFDLILSVNTSLLEIDPRVVVRSVLHGGAELANSQSLAAVDSSRGLITRKSEVFPAAAISGANTTLARLAGGKLSYIEMVHPVDACDNWTAKDESGTQIGHLLFQQKLEKGVILKARVRAAIIDREADEHVALNAYLRFSAMEPPLTV